MKFWGIFFFVQHHCSNSSVWTSFSLVWDSHFCRLATRVTSEHRCYGYLLLTGYHCTLRNTTEGPGNTYPKLTNNMMSANYFSIQILFFFFFVNAKVVAGFTHHIPYWKSYHVLSRSVRHQSNTSGNGLIGISLFNNNNLSGWRTNNAGVLTSGTIGRAEKIKLKLRHFTLWHFRGMRLLTEKWQKTFQHKREICTVRSDLWGFVKGYFLKKIDWKDQTLTNKMTHSWGIFCATFKETAMDKC